MSHTTSIELGICDRCNEKRRGCMVCAYGEPYMFICRVCSPSLCSRILEIERFAEYLGNENPGPILSETKIF